MKKKKERKKERNAIKNITSLFTSVKIIVFISFTQIKSIEQ